MTDHLRWWKNWYLKLTPEGVRMYGNTDKTYRLGYEWLKDCSLIQDWGCGFTYFKTMCRPEQYYGIDGALNPLADKQADLLTYRSVTPGLFMRHVLEHNPDWQRVLDNALASFTQRMALVLYSPLSADRTYNTMIDGKDGAPCFSFARQDLIERFGAIKYRLDEKIPGTVPFHFEHIFYLEK